MTTDCNNPWIRAKGYSPLGCQIKVGDEVTLKAKKFTVVSFTKSGCAMIKDSAGKRFRWVAKSVMAYSNNHFKTETKKVSCGDCGAEKGQLHERGCDIERCPKCYGQLFSCECDFPSTTKNKKFLVDKNGQQYERAIVKSKIDM